MRSPLTIGNPVNGQRWALYQGRLGRHSSAEAVDPLGVGRALTSGENAVIKTIEGVIKMLSIKLDEDQQGPTAPGSRDLIWQARPKFNPPSALPLSAPSASMVPVKIKARIAWSRIAWSRIEPPAPDAAGVSRPVARTVEHVCDHRHSVITVASSYLNEGWLGAVAQAQRAIFYIGARFFGIE